PYGRADAPATAIFPRGRRPTRRCPRSGADGDGDWKPGRPLVSWGDADWIRTCRTRGGIPHDPTPRSHRPPDGVVPDDPLQSRPPGRPPLWSRSPRGPGDALSGLLVPDLRPHPPQGPCPRRRPGPDPGLLRPAAGERRDRRRRPAQGPLPRLPADRLPALP